MILNWLMDKSSSKYNILNTKEIWKAPSAEEEEKIALEALFSELKKSMARKKRLLNEDDNKQSSKNKKWENQGA